MDSKNDKIDHEKQQAQFKNATEVMLDAKRKMRPIDRSAIVPLVRGEKMTKAEYLLNKDKIKAVCDAYKSGKLDEEMKDFHNVRKIIN